MIYKLIALIGPSGSGKDTILEKVLKTDSSLNRVVRYTTRPMREGEKDGVNYHYIDKEKFAELVINEMIEASEFNNWFYGTSLSCLKEDKINIGCFDPLAIDTIINCNESSLAITVICLTVPDNIRLARQLLRENNPDIEEIFRRYHADLGDFSDLPPQTIYIDNTDKENIEDVVSKILYYANRLDKI